MRAWFNLGYPGRRAKMAIGQDFASENLSVKPYLAGVNRETGFEGIIRLWRERFDEDHIAKRQILFRWLTEGNPFRAEYPPYYLLTQGERIVGMHGHMPLVFSVHGRCVMGHLAHDDLLAKAFRGRGL